MTRFELLGTTSFRSDVRSYAQVVRDNHYQNHFYTFLWTLEYSGPTTGGRWLEEHDALAHSVGRCLGELFK